jgi:hypothetical protein
MTNKDAIKAGLYTALWTFIALFGLSLVGWLNDLVQAASDENATITFGDPAILVKAAVSAAAAAASGLVGTIVRLAQVATGRGEGVKYDNA